MCLGVFIGVCTCDTPFQGPDCSIDGGKPPSNVKTELNCNGFCNKVVIIGEGFFETDAMQCEFTKIEVSGVVVSIVYHVALLVSVPRRHQRSNVAKQNKIGCRPDSKYSWSTKPFCYNS